MAYIKLLIAGLCDYPLWAVEMALSQWLKKGSYWPKLVDLRNICATETGNLKALVFRLRWIIDPRTRLIEEPKKVTPAQMEELQSKIATLLGKNKKTHPMQEPRNENWHPSTNVPLDRKKA